MDTPQRNHRPSFLRLSVAIGFAMMLAGLVMLLLDSSSFIGWVFTMIGASELTFWFLLERRRRRKTQADSH